MFEITQDTTAEELVAALATTADKRIWAQNEFGYIRSEFDECPLCALINIERGLDPERPSANNHYPWSLATEEYGVHTSEGRLSEEISKVTSVADFDDHSEIFSPTLRENMEHVLKLA